MKRLSFLLLLVTLFSCGRKGSLPGEKIITVSIPPFKFFITEIAGNNFSVNVMVPPGSNPHIYEPTPGQISALQKSLGYIANGYLGFEMSWLDRFYELNKRMKKLSLGDIIDPIAGEHHDEGHAENADPHYWVSPVCASAIALSVRDFLTELDPENRDVFEANHLLLDEKIKALDRKAGDMFSGGGKRAFMIYHPNLAYLARDYGLEEISVEYEGKEPTPSRIRELIDRARTDTLGVILVQREYDTRNARVIAAETSAEVVIIDPLSEDWLKSTTEIIDLLGNSFKNDRN